MTLYHAGYPRGLARLRGEATPVLLCRGVQHMTRPGGFAFKFHRSRLKPVRSSSARGEALFWPRRRRPSKQHPRLLLRTRGVAEGEVGVERGRGREGGVEGGKKGGREEWGGNKGDASRLSVKWSRTAQHTIK